MIAWQLGLAAENQDVLIRAAELHDVGKVAIPTRFSTRAAHSAMPSGRWCESAR
jgi:response regulator RpfG family c-di-GMP phosphodiesterase